MDSISIQNIKLSEGERRIIKYLEDAHEHAFFGPQKELAGAIGYSREHTNIMLQRLNDLGIVFIYKSLSLNRKQRLVTLYPLPEIDSLEESDNGQV